MCRAASVCAGRPVCVPRGQCVCREASVCAARPVCQSELAGGHAGGSPPAYLSVFCVVYLAPISRFPTHFPFGVICV